MLAAAEPLRQYEHGKPREWGPHRVVDGEVAGQVQLMAPGDREAEINRVAVPRDPKVAQVEAVGVDSLAAHGP